jgi:hypothetical protein
MNQNISPESLQLIANLINDKNDDLKKHVSDQIRMVKTTVQENHAVSIEARDYGKETNGRVTRLEDEIYGEYDPKNKIIKGKEGVLFYIDEVKKLRFTYKTWRHIAFTFLVLCALFIRESREFIWEKFMNFKI